MSAYRTQETTMTDEKHLVDALKEMKLCSGRKCEPQVHKEAKQLEGYHGDKRQQTAEIVIPRGQVGNASNDIGFKKNAKGEFEAIISQYDSNYYNAAWMKSLKIAYAVKKAKAIAKSNGLTFMTHTVNPQGKAVLKFKVGL